MTFSPIFKSSDFLINLLIYVAACETNTRPPPVESISCNSISKLPHSWTISWLESNQFKNSKRVDIARYLWRSTDCFVSFTRKTVVISIGTCNLRAFFCKSVYSKLVECWCCSFGFVYLSISRRFDAHQPHWLSRKASQAINFVSGYWAAMNADAVSVVD